MRALQPRIDSLSFIFKVNPADVNEKGAGKGASRTNCLITEFANGVKEHFYSHDQVGD